LAGIAASVGLGTLVSSAKSIAESMAEIDNLSKRLGISTDWVQQFQYVAKQTGLNVEDLAKILERFERAAPGEGMERMMETARLIFAGAMPGEELLKTLGEDLTPKFAQAARQNIPALMAEAPVVNAETVARMRAIDDRITRLETEMGVTAAPATLAAYETGAGVLRGVAFAGREQKRVGIPMAGPSAIATGVLRELVSWLQRRDARDAQIEVNTRRTADALTQE